MNRTRYKFVGRAGDTYIWQSTRRLPGESRVEEVRVNVHWFWNGGK